MLQTFNDMHYEHRHQGSSNVYFITKTYLDTGLEIIKEHSREVAMSTKKSTKLFIAAGTVGVLVAVVTAVYVLNNREASVISPLSSMEQARALSEGKKDKCLAENKQAASAVNEDDTYLDEEQQFSRFELIASEGIKDVPAGTNYDITINNYDGKNVKGAVKYDKDFGTYNYIIKKENGAGNWKFVSMTACE